MSNLTAIQIKNAKPGRMADGNGLFLITKKTGSQSWSVRLMVNGKRKEIGLGSATDLTLKQARERASELRVTARSTGSIPMRKVAMPTFKEASDTYVELNAARWKHPKSVPQWHSSINRYAKPILDLPVNQITTAQVAECLTPIWNTKQDTAERLLRRIRQVLSYSIAMGHAERPNAADWKDNLQHILPPPKPKTRHFAAVPVEHAPATFQRIWERRDRGNGCRALCFVILGAFRSGEVRNLTFGDLQADHILIPGQRMKAGQDHRVPLTDRMRSLIPPHVAGTDIIFPGNKKQPLSDMSLSKVHKTLEIPATVHGWRSTFRDWAAHEGYARELPELALAHLVGSATERAYRRTTMLDQRRPMMDAWERYLFG